MASSWSLAADLLEPPAIPAPADWALKHRLVTELWSGQRRILDAVVKTDRVAVQTCHTVGKSFTAALVVCWWLSVHPPGSAFVATTAPTGDQVKIILWRYIGQLHARGQLPGRTNLTEWHIGNEIVGLGRKPSDYSPVAFQGIHAPHVLVVLDEASGIPRSLWDAADTLCSTAGSKILAIGNPDSPDCHFAQVCAPTSMWETIQISAHDTPAWTGETVTSQLLDLLISRDWAERKAHEWGENSPLYQSKVLGRFPQHSEDGIIPASWLTICRHTEHPPTPPVCAGLDLGETTDRTILAVRHGKRLIAEPIDIPHTGDPMTTVGLVTRHINDLHIDRLVVDRIGIGSGYWSRLRELSTHHHPGDTTCTHQAEIIGFDAGAAADQPDKFMNRRAQLWWEARNHIREATWDLTRLDDDTAAELTAPRWRLSGSRMRTQIESKDDLRARLGRSTDRADAVLMAFWEGDRYPAGSTAGLSALATHRLIN